ncbi:MAG: VOC family protein [Williamsia sp.]|nr:VOC family protein [Williamsia sp.]
MSAATNALNWFEIPVADADRAQQFYETIFEVKMMPMDMPGIQDMRMIGFPPEPPKSSGALVKSPSHKPGTEGVVLYLNANPDLQKVLDRIEAAGGKITVPKTQITPEIGYMAFFIDSEGNSIGLHSGQ